MTRFTLIHTLAAQRKQRAAERDVEAHAARCRNCQAEKPCADLKVLELAAAMHASMPVAQ